MRLSLGDNSGTYSLSLFLSKNDLETHIQNHSLLYPDAQSSEYLLQLTSYLGNTFCWVFPDGGSISFCCPQEWRWAIFSWLPCHTTDGIWELVWGLPPYIPLNCGDFISPVLKKRKGRITGIKLRSCTSAKDPSTLTGSQGLWVKNPPAMQETQET